MQDLQVLYYTKLFTNVRLLLKAKSNYLATNSNAHYKCMNIGFRILKTERIFFFSFFSLSLLFLSLSLSLCQQIGKLHDIKLAALRFSTLWTNAQSIWIHQCESFHVFPFVNTKTNIPSLNGDAIRRLRLQLHFFTHFLTLKKFTKSLYIVYIYITNT